MSSTILRASTAALRVRSAVSVSPATRAVFFSTSSAARKDPVQATKDTLKSVDRTISDAAVKGIEVGEQATQKLKDAAGIKGKEAAASAKEVAGEAKGKTAELSGEAKGKAAELKGEAKGKL